MMAYLKIVTYDHPNFGNLIPYNISTFTVLNIQPQKRHMQALYISTKLQFSMYLHKPEAYGVLEPQK